MYSLMGENMERTKLLRMETSRLGIILSNYSILGIFIAISSILATAVYGLSVLIWLILFLVTLGLILAIIPNYMDFLTSGNLASKFINFIAPILPYVYWITFGTAVASIILMSFSYGKKPIIHIAFSSVAAGICLLFILGVLGG
jgi:hypothetical protein